MIEGIVCEEGESCEYLHMSAHLRGRVMATLTRRGSATKPRLPGSLQRTAENTMTSASRPWYPSTEDTTTYMC